MRVLACMLLSVVATLACAPVRVPGPVGAGAAVGLTVPAQHPASAWEVGDWAERLERDRGKTPLAVSRADGTVRPALARSWHRRAGARGGMCWRFRLVAPVAAEVVADWRARLAAGDAALAAMLDGVRGTPRGPAGEPDAGLVADGRTLDVCSAREDPGIPERLAHPAAWPRTSAAPGVLVPIDTNSGTSARRASGAHALFGRAVSGARGDGRAARLRREPAWDGVWALWVNPAAPWAWDPTFRTWLAGTVDRDDLVRVALDGHGEPTNSLIDDPAAAVPGPIDAPPVSAGARPRLVLVHDARDAVAAAIASRLKAVLGAQGVDLALEPVERLPLDAVGRARSPALVLFLHRPGSPDPALGLLEALVALGPEAASGAAALARGLGEATGPRTARARAVQDALLTDGRCVPLVRGHAWVGSPQRGFEAVPGGRWVRSVSGTRR